MEVNFVLLLGFLLVLLAVDSSYGADSEVKNKSMKIYVYFALCLVAEKMEENKTIFCGFILILVFVSGKLNSTLANKCIKLR